MPRPLDSLEQFYAHALAIEQEAAERYDEFAAWFEDRGEELLAGLAQSLAGHEREHYNRLRAECDGLELPPIEARRYHWLEDGDFEAPAREMLYRVATARQLLAIALDAERNARRFFAWVARSAREPQVRMLAANMAHEEAEHVRWVLQAMERHGPVLEWDALIEDGVGPGVLTCTEG